MRERRKTTASRNSLTVSELETLIKGVPGTREVKLQENENAVLFKYKDKDNDLVLVTVNELDNERIVAMMIIGVPSDRIIASLLAANQWNERRDAHSTFSYVGKASEDKFCIILEGHLLLTGGVYDSNIKAWIENFINHINLFEGIVIPIIESGKDDDEILKSEGGGLLGGIGRLVGGFLGGLAIATGAVDDTA